jgi:hypothetical protein
MVGCMGIKLISHRTTPTTISVMIIVITGIGPHFFNGALKSIYPNLQKRRQVRLLSPSAWREAKGLVASLFIVV